MKIQSPWMGRIKGSAGNMTGCKVYDKNVMRAKAFEVNNPNTAAQQVQRGYFANLTKLVASFTPDQLRTLFPSKPKAMSRRNALSMQLAEYNTMESSEKVIDFTKIDTIGNARTAPIAFTSVTVNVNKVDLHWDMENMLPYADGTTKIIPVIIDQSLGRIVITNQGAAIQDESMSVIAPYEGMVDNDLSAFPLITNVTNGEMQFGSFIIKVRPEKKSN